MTRISVVENASIRREVVAPRTTIHWNPLDDSGSVVFDTAIEESINGEFSRLIPSESIAVTLADLANRTIIVQGIEVPFLLIAGAIKQVFDDIYTERDTPADPGEEEPQA